MLVPGNLEIARKRERPAKIIEEEPDTETLINQEYDEQDIDISIRYMAYRKGQWNDGIPEEENEETRTWAIKSIAKITNQIKDGQEIPENWTNGTIVYIY